MPPGQVALYIFGIIAIIVGAYYVTYYISVKSSGSSGSRPGRGRNINLLERFAISKDKSFCIVEVFGKVYVVGITNQAMTVMDTLEADEYAELCPDGEARAPYPQFAGGKLQKKIVNGFADFLAGRMGKSTPPKDGGDFAEKLRAAGKSNEEPPRDAAGTQMSSSDDPEGEG